MRREPEEKIGKDAEERSFLRISEFRDGSRSPIECPTQVARWNKPFACAVIFLRIARAPSLPRAPTSV